MYNYIYIYPAKYSTNLDLLKEPNNNDNWLVVRKLSWKMMEFVNGKDDNPYIMENKSHVPNHQPDYVYIKKSVWMKWNIKHEDWIFIVNDYDI